MKTNKKSNETNSIDSLIIVESVSLSVNQPKQSLMKRNSMKTILCLNSSSDSTFPRLSVLQKIAKKTEIVYVDSLVAAESLLESGTAISIFVTTQLSQSILLTCKESVQIIFFSTLPFEKVASIYNGASGSHYIQVIPSSPFYLDFLFASIEAILDRNDFDRKNVFTSPVSIVTFSLLDCSKNQICKEIEILSDSVLRSTFKSKMQASIAEEMLMNAEKNAPPTIKAPSQTSISLTCEYNEHIFLLSAKDPYGSLSASIFFQYVMRQPGSTGEHLIETKRSGAGLGLYKIIHSSHGLLCHVQENVKTEMTSVFFPKMPLLKVKKQPRLIQYFRHP